MVYGGPGIFIPITRGGSKTYIYSISLEESKGKMKVASDTDFPKGTCIDVMVSQIKADSMSYTAFEANLEESERCKQ